MHGNGIGKFQFIQLLKGILLHNTVVKRNPHTVVCPVDVQDFPNVAVEGARSLFASLFPDNLIVVFDLHHTVAFPEHRVPVCILPFALDRWVVQCLHQSIEIFRSRLSSARWGNDLHISLCFLTVSLGQTVLIQVGNGLRNSGVAFTRKKEKVIILPIQNRHFPLIDCMGIRNDQRFLRLSENLRQSHGAETFRINNIPKYIPRSHARKLVSVTDQNHARTRLDRTQKAGK